MLTVKTNGTYRLACWFVDADEQPRSIEGWTICSVLYNSQNQVIANFDVVRDPDESNKYYLERNPMDVPSGVYKQDILYVAANGDRLPTETFDVQVLPGGTCASAGDY